MIPRGMTTAVDKSLLARIGDAHLAFPDGFTVHPGSKPVLEKRREMAYEGKVDWAFGELLALGSFLAEGKLIRLSGQDTRRGTFTQRHSVIIDRKTGEEFTPLQLLTINPDGTPTGGRFLVYDSALSEYAAVGFEYGYSVGNQDALVMGRRSSATSSTVRSRSSTSSSAPARPSGAALPMWCCCCRTATKGRARTTPRVGSNASCSCGPRVDDHRDAVHPGELLPPAAPARPRRGAPPVDRVHPEVDAAQQGRGERHPGLHRTEVPLDPRGAHLHRRRRRPRQGHPNPVDQREDLLRAGGAQEKDNRDDVAIVRSSSWRRCPSGGWPTPWTPTRTRGSSSGFRRNRPTRVPGRRSG